MGARHSVNEGFGEEFYRKGHSVRRFGPFSEPTDSENLFILCASPSQISGPTRALRPSFSQSHLFYYFKTEHFGDREWGGRAQTAGAEGERRKGSSSGTSENSKFSPPLQFLEVGPPIPVSKHLWVAGNRSFSQRCGA